MSNIKPALSGKRIKRSFPIDGRTLEILSSVDISVNPGEVVGIVGVSGTGKSTLLHILGGLDRPSGGEVLIDGENIFEMSDDKRSATRGKKIGFVFQFHHLLPEFTAIENALLPSMISGSDSGEAREKAVELLETVGLADRMNHRPGKLSGGEQQRAAIVRALINNPKVLLADEPTGNLDAHTATDVFSILREIAEKKNLATVVVTHNQSLTERMDSVYELHEGVLEKR